MKYSLFIVNSAFFKMEYENESEVYDTNNLSDDDEVDILESDQQVDNAVSSPGTTTESDLTLSLLIDGKLFALVGTSNRGKCLLCKNNSNPYKYSEANNASNLTKHLVSGQVLNLIG